ncbi:MFS transporter [Euhalothece natronophila Z-M001]|uniref:MFS transporter n=2 Tax=Euhalothece TaxID=65097 RepID=A0A5B8NR34_9CHRO|nr:MFS transporter [Euhalothece natronophila Z-M001]
MRLFIILAAGSLITMVGGVASPVLPEVITVLDFDRALAGNLVSIHALTIALFSPILGFVADKMGPLRVLVPSLVLYSIFGVAGAFLSDFWLLLASRALLGATAGGIAAGSLGVLGKLYDQERRAQIIAYATAALTIAGIVFPLLGGTVGSLHWRYAFALYSIAFPLAIMAVLAFPEIKNRRKPNTTNISSELKRVLLTARVLELLILVALTAAIMYSVVIYAPMYLKEELQLGTVANGVLLATRALTAGLTSALGAKKLAKRYSIQGAIALGFGLMALTLFTIPLLDYYLLLLVSASIFGMGFGLVLPNLYSSLSNASPQEIRSSILAIGIGTSFFGQFLSPVLLGPMLNHGGFTGVFNTASVMALLAGGFLLRRMP